MSSSSCFIGCLALFTPRLALFFVFVFSNYLARAYETVLWPLLGFFFMPATTLAYAWAVNTYGTVSGGALVIVVIAVLMDLGLVGVGSRARRRRSR